MAGLMNMASLQTKEAQVRSSAKVEWPLQCVWTSHPSREHSCRSLIPAGVVAAAWRQELAQGRTDGGFFRFTWRGGVWLGYGLEDGRVRGVYCPEHRAERDKRAPVPAEAPASATIALMG